MNKKEWEVPSVIKIPVKRITKSGTVGKDETNNASHSHAESVPHKVPAP